MTEKFKVLLLGSGGRESAIAWKLGRSPLLESLVVAPGNAGTAAAFGNVSLNPIDFAAVEKYVRENGIDLIFVGNEDPLVAGISDYFARQMPEVLVFGPSKAAAQLEGSKDFAKAFMQRHGIPTARYRSFTADTVADARAYLRTLKPPYVLKADGLAAGKGVLIINDLAECDAALDEMLHGKFGTAGNTVVIEEFLSGVECSVFVLTDGSGQYRILPVAKDYKRIGEGDTGLNTGGMGAVSRVPFADADFMRKVEQRIVRPTVEGLAAEGLTYRGVIFLGLINVGGEPMVIEYNVRFGDPETEVVLLRLDADLLQLAVAAARGDLGTLPTPHSAKSAATVMAVSKGYPEAYAKGKVMTIAPVPEGTVLYPAGTAPDADGRTVTAGGRVIAVSTLADTLADALGQSYSALAGIDFEGITYRRDIGRDMLAMLENRNS